MELKKVENQIMDFFKDAEVIDSYTRKEALEDGSLVDVTPLAKECGFKIPVALTSRVYGEVVVPPSGAQGFQDDIGRLWDMLNILRTEIKQSKSRQSQIDFYFLVQNKPEKLQKQYLKAICGPGDDAEPVITIMFPEED